MLPSRYNYFVRRDDGVIGYNARTGKFALVTEAVFEALNRDVIGDVPDLDSLRGMGFVHEGEERELIDTRFQSMRARKDYLHLTLVPTLDCNLACPYCFQNKYRDSPVWSAETQDATLAFIRQRLAEGRREVQCVWFGGEPLLAKDIVLDMSDRISAVVSAGGGRLNGGLRILTNAVLLDGETARELAAVGIKRAQISIDSLVYDGCKRRGVIDKSGAPSILVHHIRQAKEHLSVDVRINVSAENVDDMPRIMDVLDENGLSGCYGVARVHNHEEETGNERDLVSGAKTGLPKITRPAEPTTVSRKDYSDFELDHFMPRLSGAAKLLPKLTPKGHFCAATQGHMFVIDPAGFVSRCWHSAGVPSEAFTNVHDVVEPPPDAENTSAWLGYSPFRYRACTDCKVLPLCMGGCAHPRVFMDAKKPPCEAIKFQIQDCVEAVAKALVLETDAGAASASRAG